MTETSILSFFPRLRTMKIDMTEVSHVEDTGRKKGRGGFAALMA
jgi:hypothetical protein